MDATERQRLQLLVGNALLIAMVMLMVAHLVISGVSGLDGAPHPCPLAAPGDDVLDVGDAAGPPELPSGHDHRLRPVRGQVGRGPTRIACE